MKKIEMLESIMKKILQDHYEGIYNFFYDITQSEGEVKFLIARRCLVLYQIFLPIFKKNNEKFQVIGKVYSDRAIEKYRECLKDKTILLADDILIHGRHVNELYKELKKYVSSEKINVWVYMLSKEPKCLEPELENKIKKREDGSGWKWRTLSNAIVKAICVSNVPYTSFVCSYEGTDEIRSFLEKNADRKAAHETDETAGCKWDIVFPELEVPGLFKVLSHINCVRTYDSPEMESYTVIPYVITKAVRAKSIQKFFEKFSVHFQSFEKIYEDLQKDGDSLWNLYRMRLFNAVLSHLYGIFVFKDLYKPEKMEIDTIEKSFGKDIADEFYRMDEKSAASIFEADYTDLDSYIFDDPEKIPVGSEKDYRSLIYEQHRRDEKRAEQGLDKLKGNSLDQMFTKEQSIEEKERIARIIISLMDVGFVSAVYAFDQEKQYYASFISAGEQSYKYILETYAAAVRMMLFLEVKHKDVIEYVKYIANELNWSEKQLNELKNFHEDTKGRLFDWNIESILREPGRREGGEEILKANEKYIDNEL